MDYSNLSESQLRGCQHLADLEMELIYGKEPTTSTRECRALFDLEGNLIAAKLMTTRYGLVWGILASDDPRSRITGWITAKTRSVESKGFYQGTVLAPSHRQGDVWVRSDGGFSRDVSILDSGQ